MKVLLILMSGLEMLDGLFTNFAVGEGLAKEANILMESLVLNGWFVLLKILGAVVCSFCLWRVYKRFPRIALTVTSGIVVFYSAVAAWNFGIVALI